MIGKYIIPAAGTIYETVTTTIIHRDTNLLIVRTRDGNCLSKATSSIIIIMSCNTRVAV